MLMYPSLEAGYWSDGLRGRGFVVDIQGIVGYHNDGYHVGILASDWRCGSLFGDGHGGIEAYSPVGEEVVVVGVRQTGSGPRSRTTLLDHGYGPQTCTPTLCHKKRGPLVWTAAVPHLCGP